MEVSPRSHSNPNVRFTVDIRQWLQRINPFSSSSEAVALDFTVLENVLEPVVSFRALLRTFDDADPEIDGRIHCFSPLRSYLI